MKSAGEAPSARKIWVLVPEWGTGGKNNRCQLITPVDHTLSPQSPQHSDLPRKEPFSLKRGYQVLGPNFLKCADVGKQPSAQALPREVRTLSSR